MGTSTVDDDERVPQEDDWYTADCKNFYQYGKPVLSIFNPTNCPKYMWHVLTCTMNAHQVWANVWLEDDHGGLTLLDPWDAL